MNVGMFSKAELARVVAETVPPDRTNAVVLTVDLDGMAMAVKMKLNKRWDVEAAYRRDWKGDEKAGALVAYSW